MFGISLTNFGSSSISLSSCLFTVGKIIFSVVILEGRGKLWR